MSSDYIHLCNAHDRMYTQTTDKLIRRYLQYIIHPTSIYIILARHKPTRPILIHDPDRKARTRGKRKRFIVNPGTSSHFYVNDEGVVAVKCHPHAGKEMPVPLLFFLSAIRDLSLFFLVSHQAGGRVDWLGERAGTEGVY